MPRRLFAWSWADSPADAEEFRKEACGLVDEIIARVKYVDIDYRADDFRGETSGPRDIERDIEWADPTWRHVACDTVDFGVEMETVGGRLFTVSWEVPGLREGLGLRELPLLGNAVVNEADVAIWDVTSRSSWIDLAGRAVTSVELHYEPWDESGALWCDWISIGIGERNVEFLLGDASSRDAEIKPSANNIAVVFDAHRLPVWLTDRKR